MQLVLWDSWEFSARLQLSLLSYYPTVSLMSKEFWIRFSVLVYGNPSSPPNAIHPGVFLSEPWPLKTKHGKVKAGLFYLIKYMSTSRALITVLTRTANSLLMMYDGMSVTTAKGWTTHCVLVFLCVWLGWRCPGNNAVLNAISCLS